MFKKLFFVLGISALFLGTVSFAQDEKAAEKLDFSDIQSTPEKLLKHFFDFFQKVDAENLKKICVSELHEEIAKFAEMMGEMEGVRFEFKTLDIITKDDFSLAISEVCIIEKKHDVDIAIMSMIKIDDKWFIKELDDLAENAPEWAKEAYTKIRSNRKLLSKLREYQASPYFVCFEYVGAFGNRDLEMMKRLTPSDTKSQETIKKFHDSLSKDIEFKLVIKAVVEKEDFAVCLLDVTADKFTSSAIFLLKNEGYKELPSWKVFPMLRSEDLLKDASLKLPKWVTNQIKWWLDKKDEIKTEDKDKMFSNHLDIFCECMTTGKFKEVLEYLTEKDKEQIEEGIDSIEKISKFEYAVYHVKGDEAYVMGNIEVLEKGDTEPEKDDFELGGKFADSKWTFTFHPDDDESPWFNDVEEAWEMMDELKDVINPRPSEILKKKYMRDDKIEKPDVEEPDSEKPDDENPDVEEPKTEETKPGEPIKGQVKGYMAKNVNINLDKPGIYRILLKCITENGLLAFNLKKGESQIAYSKEVGNLRIVEIYLIPGEYTVQVMKGYMNKPIDVLEFELTVSFVNNDEIPADAEAIKLDTEYVLENLSSINAKEFFFLCQESGYYNLDFALATEEKVADTNVSIEIHRLPNRWYQQNFKVPTNRVIFLPEGLNKIIITRWQDKVLPVKLKFSKVKVLKSGDEMQFTVPKISEIGWQINIDKLSRINIEISGKNAQGLFFRVMQNADDTTLETTWGNKRVCTEILDPGIYLVKLTGDYSMDAQDIILKADIKPLEFKSSEFEFRGEALVMKADKLNNTPINMDLSSFETSKFVCINVKDNATGLTIPDATIMIKRDAIPDVNAKNYIRTESIENYYRPSFKGLGFMYGYFLPAKHMLNITVPNNDLEVKVEFKMDSDIDKLESGKFNNIKMKKNEIMLFKFDVEIARKMLFDAIFPDAFGQVEVDIMHNGFILKNMNSWMMKNGVNTNGLFCKGTYFVVIRRVDRKAWTPNPEVDELPIIINLIKNVIDQ